MTTTNPSEPIVGVVDDPCRCLPPAPPEVAVFLETMRAARANRTPAPVPDPELVERYNDWMVERRLLDHGELCRYLAANAALPPADDRRVVFIGDSITEGWALHEPGLFDTWINRGIAGQTAPQILARWRADALALTPRAIHIMAGVNDIAGNTGPTTLAWIEDNIRNMSELARANGIQIVLGSLTPAARFGWRQEIECRAHISNLNAWLEAYAASTNAIHVDYFAALSDGVGGMRAELSG